MALIAVLDPCDERVKGGRGGSKDTAERVCSPTLRKQPQGVLGILMMDVFMRTQTLPSSETSDQLPVLSCEVAVIGGGPAGLMAAERLRALGHQVVVFDGKASVGRKFLLAGKGGLNLSHSEPFDAFVQRYGAQASALQPMVQAFDGDAVRAWAKSLGIETFVGSSGRVFPVDMKAAPLLRAWLTRLRASGVVFRMRHRWTGWNAEGHLCLETPEGLQPVQAQAVVLALGGASWPQLGSDGAWLPWLQARGVEVSALQPANCGFDVAWSPVFAERFAGTPLKAVALKFDDGAGTTFARRGEFVVTQGGIEGSLVYAASRGLRDAIARDGQATLHLDLLPEHSAEKVLAQVRHPRGSRSLSSHLKGRLGLDAVKMGLLYEALPKEAMADAERVAQTLKALPLTLLAPRPVAETISTAGGVTWSGLDEGLMCRALPGVFCAGEMLDWEAPTGGYLLTACFATGQAAAQGVSAYLHRTAA